MTRQGWLSISIKILNISYLLSSVALLIWAALQRFRLPQAPLVDPDIKGYLGPAISVLAGKPFIHLIGRSFPYPAFISLIITAFHDFRAIAVTQHLLGLASGALILLAWNAAGDLLPAGGIPKPLFRFMGLAPAYVSLASSTAISFEQQIRPEAIFPFLAILNIWLSLLFLRARFIRRSPSWLWLGPLNVFIACLIYMAKPSFGLATLTSTLPVWLSLLLPGPSARDKALLAAAATLPAALLLFLPEHLLKQSDPWSSLFLPETLLTVHAPVIEQQMAEDLASPAPLPFPRPVVQAAHDLLATELVKAANVTTKTYPSLGFNPDYLMYDDSFCINFAPAMHFTGKAMGNFCMTYYLRALRNHPGVIAAKIARQMALFYAPRNPAFTLAKGIDLSEAKYSRAAQLMQWTTDFGPENPAENLAISRYIATCNQLADQEVIIPQARRFVEWLQFFSTHYLDLLGVALLSPLLLFLRPLRAHFLWLVVALWLVFSYNFGNCLTIAVVHSLDVARYVRVQLIFTVFAECLSLGLLLELATFGMRNAARDLLSRRPNARSHSNT